MTDSYTTTEHRVAAPDGVELWCRDYRPARAAGPGAPAAPVVLCVPGLTRNSRDFDSLADWLAGSYRVLTPDLRGRGRSGRAASAASYQPLQYIGDLSLLLQSLAVQQVFWIGTSLGGLLAMMMAAMQPALLRGVVLNDVGPEIDPAGVARIAGYVGKLPPVLTWADAAAQSRLIHGAALPDFTDEDWMRLARCTYRDDGHGRPVPDMDPAIGDAMRTAAGPAPDLWPLFRALRAVPTLAIRGALSDILSPATFERMRAEKPDLVTLVLEGRGHAPTLDEPSARVSIRALLERVAGSA